MRRQVGRAEQTDDHRGKEIHTNFANARKADGYAEAEDLREVPCVDPPAAWEQAELTHFGIEHGKRRKAHGLAIADDSPAPATPIAGMGPKPNIKTAFASPFAGNANKVATKKILGRPRAANALRQTATNIIGTMVNAIICR